MASNLIERLSAAGLRVSRARLAVAERVLATDTHPTADQVWAALRAEGAKVSRATVYKTLAAFTEAGLLRAFAIEGRHVFDPRLEPHHHTVDADTGMIRDLPAGALSVRGLGDLEGVEVLDHQVVVRVRARGDGSAPGPRA